MPPKIKSIEDRYRKLDEISHVLLRPGRYVGSVTPHTAETWTYDVDSNKMEKREITWNPALLKIFDEVISNSVDFSKTEEGKHLDTIKVTMSRMSAEISIWDNGGISVVKHKEYDQYVPEMIFELRSGSNFDDTEDSMATGQNGEGAALTAIFSEEFTVKTSDGKNSFVQTRTENSRVISKAVVKPSTKRFTEILFIPDFTTLGMEDDTFSDGNYARLVKRVADVAGCNPHLKVYLNGSRIKINSFSDYIKLYVDDCIYEENEHWKVGISNSEDGFSHVSFVNGTETITGGNHIWYISEQIVVKLREYFKKKHKVDVKPADIRNHFLLFIDAAIVRPRYSSQTKEDLITEAKNFGTSIEISDKFIQKVIKSPIVQSVLDWIEAKESAAEAAKLRALNKDADKTNLRKISKFTDASEKVDRRNCMLALAEGDSAANSVLSARTSLIGCYPLKGKPINALGATTKELAENKEFTELISIMGLKIGQKVRSPDDTRFGKLVIVSDADADGSHIAGLIVALIRKFWPEMFSLGMVYKFQTPIMKVMSGKEVLYFDTLVDFENWVDKNPKKKFTSRYLKGLGTSTAADFKYYFANMDKNLIQLTAPEKADFEVVDMVFGKGSGDSDRRKVWLDIE